MRLGKFSAQKLQQTEQFEAADLLHMGSHPLLKIADDVVHYVKSQLKTSKTSKRKRIVLLADSRNSTNTEESTEIQQRFLKELYRQNASEQRDPSISPV